MALDVPLTVMVGLSMVRTMVPVAFAACAAVGAMAGSAVSSMAALSKSAPRRFRSFIWIPPLFLAGLSCRPLTKNPPTGMAGGSCGLFAVHVGAVCIDDNLDKVAVVGGVDVVEHDSLPSAKDEQQIAVAVIAELIVIDDPGIARLCIQGRAEQIVGIKVGYTIIILVAVVGVTDIDRVQLLVAVAVVDRKGNSPSSRSSAPSSKMSTVMLEFVMLLMQITPISEMLRLKVISL